MNSCPLLVMYTIFEKSRKNSILQKPKIFTLEIYLPTKLKNADSAREESGHVSIYMVTKFSIRSYLHLYGQKLLYPVTFSFIRSETFLSGHIFIYPVTNYCFNRKMQTLTSGVCIPINLLHLL